MANEIFCDNCGCNMLASDGTSTGGEITLAWRDEAGVRHSHTFDACRCCIDGIVQILTENREQLHRLHGVNCHDILPVGYRCGHSPAE